MYWDGSGYACVRLAYQLETLPFLPLITMASSLDLCNPPCKAARYLAWKAAIRRRAQVTDSHTHIHTYTHTHTHTHLTLASLCRPGFTDRILTFHKLWTRVQSEVALVLGHSVSYGRNNRVRAYVTSNAAMFILIQNGAP